MKSIDGQDVLWLWGTDEQIGYAEGALLCRRIPRFFADYYLDYFVPLLGKGYGELSAKLLPRYRVPESDERMLRAMLQGIRERCPAGDLLVESKNLEPEAGGKRELRYEDLVFSNIAVELFLSCSSFTVWGQASATGGTLHARNVDFPLDPSASYSREQVVKVIASGEGGGARWISLSWPGSLMCHSCFLDNGFAFTLNGSNPLPGKPSGASVPLASALRALLLGAPSSPELLQARLAEQPLFAGGNLVVSWPCSGPGCVGGSVLELDGDVSHPDGRVTLRRPGEVNDGLGTSDAIVATNHFLKRVAKAPDRPESIAHYETVRDGIKQAIPSGGIDLVKAHQLMSAVAVRGEVVTTFTVLFDAQRRELSVYRSPGKDKAATDAKPTVFRFDALFAELP